MCFKPKEAERRSMEKEDEIESLIASTMMRIRDSLDHSQPKDVKVYAEALFLLRQTQSLPPSTWKRIEKFSEHIPF